MKTLKTLSISILIFNCLTVCSQNFSQFFDDSTANNQINFTLDSTTQNVWEIGVPQKTNFNSAASPPNVLVSKLVQDIPSNTTSSFQYQFNNNISYHIIAIQWMQKLDLDTLGDYGIIEFSVDNGITWQNAFDNPNVYNFYGFDEKNIITLANSQKAFSGFDNDWKDIWLCYDASYIGNDNNLLVKHTLVTDSINNNNEGWMLDNFSIHATMIHTISKQNEQAEYLKVAPNPTNGRVEISIKKLNEFHIIEEMELLNEVGQVLKKWNNIPTKYWFKMNDYENGIYFLKVKTNKQSKTVKLIHQK